MSQMVLRINPEYIKSRSDFAGKNDTEGKDLARVHICIFWSDYNLIPRLLRSGMLALQLCRCGEPAFFFFFLDVTMM